MIGKNTTKYICSLQKKKYRIRENAFIAEGYKLIEDAIKAKHPIKKIFCTKEYFNKPLLLSFDKEECTELEMRKISALSTPSSILAVCEIKKSKPHYSQPIILALDDVQDPGNVGTLLRTCNWFGINTIILSEGCADIYNPKVVQATMGAIFHVDAIRGNLETELQKLSSMNYSICGTFLEGTNIYTTALPNKAVIIMGNEGKGISPEIEKLVTDKLYIPFFGNENTQESLNVSIATAIIISEFSRKSF